MIRVFVVDDEKLARKGIIALLPWERFNMQVVGEAGSGDKALEFLRQNEIDLLFTDLSMPGMSGFELIQEVGRSFPDIRIVVLTCHQDFGYIQEVLRMGVIDYIVKTQLEMEPVEEILGRIAGRIRQEKENRLLKGADAAAIDRSQFTPESQKYSEEVVQCISNSLRYIHDHLTEGIHQDDVARKVNMSRGYFSQCFKEIVGKSFGDYVRDLKINKAKELLQKSNKPVYWIAEQLGFQDDKYFSKVFREYTGMLPTEYRLQSRG